MSNIDAAYRSAGETAIAEANFQSLRSASTLLRLAYTVYDAAVEREKPDLERESAYMDRNFDQTVRRLKLAQQDLDVPTDRTMLAANLKRYQENGLSIELPQPDQLESLYHGTSLNQPEALEKVLTMSPQQLAAMDDSFMKLAIKLYPEYQRLRELNKQREGELNQLYGDLLTVKQMFQQDQFVPDANATLRLTYGTVRGYSPEDAVWMRPATTLSGVVAKTTGEEPFVTPDKVVQLHQAGELGRYAHPDLNDVPVALLYDTDTTGGNSGSPILDSRGRLVGVNFDRAFEATINDFAWNTSYSRSIGVDIRYVLWVTELVYGADFLTQEMGLE